jgi:predicted GNAT family acetyltransferase
VKGDLLVRNNMAEQHYEGIVNGRVVGWVEYRKFGNRIVVRHTVVDVEQRGSGIGSGLVRGVLDDLAAQGQTLTNYCPFVSRFIESHPEYEQLTNASRTQSGRSAQSAD